MSIILGNHHSFLIDSGTQERVVRETWGHLAPVPQQKYSGTIIFAEGTYGDIVVLRSQFEGLDGSPWYFEDEQDFVGGYILKQSGAEEGPVYKFTGYYQKCKNERGRFVGKTHKLILP